MNEEARALGAAAAAVLALRHARAPSPKRRKNSRSCGGGTAWACGAAPSSSPASSFRLTLTETTPGFNPLTTGAKLPGGWSGVVIGVCGSAWAKAGALGSRKAVPRAPVATRVATATEARRGGGSGWSERAWTSGRISGASGPAARPVMNASMEIGLTARARGLRFRQVRAPGDRQGRGQEKGPLLRAARSLGRKRPRRAAGPQRHRRPALQQDSLLRRDGKAQSLAALPVFVAAPNRSSPAPRNALAFPPGRPRDGDSGGTDPGTDQRRAAAGRYVLYLMQQRRAAATTRPRTRDRGGQPPRLPVVAAFGLLDGGRHFPRPMPPLRLPASGTRPGEGRAGAARHRLRAAPRHAGAGGPGAGVRGRDAGPRPRLPPRDPEAVVRRDPQGLRRPPRPGRGRRGGAGRRRLGQARIRRPHPAAEAPPALGRVPGAPARAPGQAPGRRPRPGERPRRVGSRGGARRHDPRPQRRAGAPVPRRRGRGDGPARRLPRRAVPGLRHRARRPERGRPRT